VVARRGAAAMGGGICAPRTSNNPMRLFGFDITRTKAAASANLVPAASSGSWWWPTVREPFTGAWQRNMELNQETGIRHHAVYACITLIAQDVAKLRIKLVEQDPNTRIWEEVTVPAFSPVLRKPNRFQNRIQFLESWLYSKLTWGNTYVLKERDARNIVVALYVLDPSRTRTLVAPDGAVYYELATDHLAGVTEDSLVVPASEIIHDRMSTIFHPLCGVSPLTACALSTLQGLEGQKQSIEQFRNQAVPSGIIVAPGPISQETADRVKAKWQANYGGQNVGRVAILGDNMKFEQMAVNPIDAQFIETMKWSAETICSAFHVPAFMVTQTAPTYNNVEALQLSYYGQCLQSHIEKIELGYDEGLGLVDVTGHIYGTELDVDDGLLRMDTKTKMDVIGLGVQRAIFSPNEARARFDLPPVDGGETPLAQQQYFPIHVLADRELAPPAPSINPAPLASPPKPSEPTGASERGLAEADVAVAAWYLSKALQGSEAPAAADSD
jgi:HK97 family phage portal protein